MKFKTAQGKMTAVVETIKDIYDLIRLQLPFVIEVSGLTDNDEIFALETIEVGLRENNGTIVPLKTKLDVSFADYEKLEASEIIKNQIAKYINNELYAVEVFIKFKDFRQYEDIIGLLPSMNQKLFDSCFLIVCEEEMTKIIMNEGNGELTEIYHWSAGTNPIFVFRKNSAELNMKTNIDSVDKLLC